MMVKVAIAPCDKCGRELITDEWLGSPYWQAGCADIHADGCHGQADDSQAKIEFIDID